jgi:hypothetical protein
VYIRARLVDPSFVFLAPRRLPDASTKVRNFESFSIQEAAVPVKARLSFVRFACRTSFTEGGRFL